LTKPRPVRVQEAKLRAREHAEDKLLERFEGVPPIPPDPALVAELEERARLVAIMRTWTPAQRAEIAEASARALGLDSPRTKTAADQARIEARQTRQRPPQSLKDCDAGLAAAPEKDLLPPVVVAVNVPPPPSRPPGKLEREDQRFVHPHEVKQVDPHAPPEMSARKAQAWRDGGPVTFHEDETYAQCATCGVNLPPSAWPEHARDSERCAGGGLR
jgi:hypothetical protein